MSQQKPQLNRSSFWRNIKVPGAVAHRGGNLAGIDKENTLEAFKKAYDAGFRWFETDVVPTKDGVLLAIHGRGYQRRPNKDLPSRLSIQRITYKQAKENIKIGAEGVATLEELLEKFPDANFFVDPKTIKAAPVLAKFLQTRENDIGRISVGSFIPYNNFIVYKRVKQATGKEVNLTLLGPLKASPIKLGSLGWLPLAKLIAKAYVAWTRATSVMVPYSWVINDNGENLVQFAHQLSLKIGVYTPNRAEDVKKCLDKGVDVIITDNLMGLPGINICK
jgi:glycerophosphoryl diester phosphodiesterase